MMQRERLLRSLARESVDRPPFICPGGMMSMIVTEVMDRCGCSWPEAHSDAALMARLTAQTSLVAGVENVGVPFCMTVEAEGMGGTVDLGSRENEPRIVAYAMEKLSDLDRITALNPAEGRAKVCVDAVRLLKREVPQLPIVANLTGPVSLATSLVDPLLYYRALRRDPEGARRLTEIATENAIVFGDALIEAGADAVCIADPSATGELIGGKAFADFVLPQLNRMTGHFRSWGIPSIVHICGDVKALGTVLAALEAEAVSVDAMVGIPQLKELACGKVTMGNVSTFLLEKRDPDAVRRAGNDCLEKGVDILAPACGIGPRTPIENIRALAESVRKDG
ncbi:uroporphyrinogen decarboxylase family protein [Geomesophilobacter sediminis]|uniref:Methylcobamide--CoM methyltransferase n=1 Tax=Geomesophilobacter sediminis TaxID=2798584 RepID=A0A8J7LWT7_9BACT|nr:uroporphyrinogen decarboxylase family protein [Geomesophilobacter sediminis]MBJ6726235.1 methylcobamide--CoM methyltransferase [Geomesophilobacter sediminis]